MNVKAFCILQRVKHRQMTTIDAFDAIERMINGEDVDLKEYRYDPSGSIDDFVTGDDLIKKSIHDYIKKMDDDLFKSRLNE
jgi:hypothetical protein